jgi:hypothetical protein
MRKSIGRRTAWTGALLASVALALPLASQATPKTPKVKAPHAATERAVHVDETTVALDGTVNPHGQETTCYFQYGATPLTERRHPPPWRAAAPPV